MEYEEADVVILAAGIDQLLRDGVSTERIWLALCELLRRQAIINEELGHIDT